MVEKSSLGLQERRGRCAGDDVLNRQWGGQFDTTAVASQYFPCVLSGEVAGLLVGDVDDAEWRGGFCIADDVVTSEH